jgi:hypothetical protein
MVALVAPYQYVHHYLWCHQHSNEGDEKVSDVLPNLPFEL